MNLDPVTVRWAGALFGLAKRKGVLDEVRSDLMRLGAEVGAPRVRNWLASATDSTADRRKHLAVLTDGFHQLTRNCIDLILDRRRDAVLIELHAAFEERWLAEQGVVLGTVELARDLDESELSKLAASLGKRLGKTVRLTVKRNAALIGGLRVRVGARMLDYTVQGRLEGLRRRLMEAPVTSAEQA